MSDNQDKTDVDNIVTLEYPFTWREGEEITEIDLPRPKAMHIRGLNFKKIENGDADEILKLIQKLTGQPPKWVDKIDLADIIQLADKIQDFLPNGPQAGKMQSHS